MGTGQKERWALGREVCIVQAWQRLSNHGALKDRTACVHSAQFLEVRVEAGARQGIFRSVASFSFIII